MHKLLGAMDARYPLLAVNDDGSVLAMLHSLVSTIEIKTRLSTGDIKKMWNDAARIMSLANQVIDLYYHLVQNAYYTLGQRNYLFTDIGCQVMDYMSWSTCSWDKYYEMKKR